MTMNNIWTGTLGGFVAAALIDVHAFMTSPSNVFDWQLMFKRWVAGAMAGALTALGTGA